MKNYFATIPYLVLIMVTLSCQPNKEWDKESALLIQQANELDQRHQLINASIKDLWDRTSNLLECELPSDLPPVDRNIFLNSHSAYHIRMFMSYKHLNKHIHSIVDAAAKQDEILAAQLYSLAEEKQEFENQKNKFLQNVSQRDESLYQHYAGLFQIKSDDTDPHKFFH